MIIHKKTVGSTNDFAMELAKDKKTSFGTMVIADEQTKGRGRYKRRWISEKGNLFCSIITHSDNCFKDAGKVSFAASLAILETLEHFGAKDVSLKWPNDVLVDGKKISGILIETDGKKEGVMIIGIGVNLKAAPERTTNYPAIALSDIINKDINPKTFAIHMRLKLLNLLKQDDLNKLWSSKAMNKEQEIKVNLRNNSIIGIFKGVNKQGHLTLETKDGEKITISAGDVFL
jgi:BirA family transcriptional regulator, biotin operon repressor / biotin---[acetyl-CoA-carboxylase] ligase